MIKNVPNPKFYILLKLLVLRELLQDALKIAT